jgi:hypothetical protein
LLWRTRKDDQYPYQFVASTRDTNSRRFPTTIDEAFG